MNTHDRFDNISPVDFRYQDEKTSQYLSENAFTRAKLRVEAALVWALSDQGICPVSVAEEIERACANISTEEVYEEEERTKHDIRALVNCIQRKVSDQAKPFVHMTATSYDIVDTANALRFKAATKELLIPALKELEMVLIGITMREKDTAQTGRTHGQHAVPITFGFAMASFVDRLGNSIMTMGDLSNRLCGKFAGAVGAYNASSLFFSDPETFEENVLSRCDVVAAIHSSQIVPPEPMIRLLSEVTITAGILANLADDMRHLQRTEIGEVGEEFGLTQVGSSTMPQKRNPINFENAKSIWKTVAPRMTTVYMDGISEHQRDLTGSASTRTHTETIAYVVSMAKRLTRTMKKLRVDHANLARNLALQKDLVVAEPLYIILAALGHPDAHEKVRELTLKAQGESKPLETLACSDPELAPFFEKMTDEQRSIIKDSSLYTGIAAKKAVATAERWRTVLFDRTTG